MGLPAGGGREGSASDRCVFLQPSTFRVKSYQSKRGVNTSCENACDREAIRYYPNGRWPSALHARRWGGLTLANAS